MAYKYLKLLYFSVMASSYVQTNAHSSKEVVVNIDFASDFQSYPSVQAGEVFSFRFRSNLALGMKISSQDDQQNILLLSGDSRGHEPRVLSGIPPLQSVLVHPAMLVVKSLPTDLRDSVPNGAPGEVLITENKRFMWAANDEEHDYDPVLIDIHSGALSGISTTEPAAIFRHWRIVVRRGEIEDILLSYPPAATPAASG
jgi:hypothetical protein